MASWPFRSWHYFACRDLACVKIPAWCLLPAVFQQLPHVHCLAPEQAYLCTQQHTALTWDRHYLLIWVQPIHITECMLSTAHTWWEVSYRLSELVCSFWWAANSVWSGEQAQQQDTHKYPQHQVKTEDTQQKLWKEVKDFGWLPLPSPMTRTAPHSDLTSGTQSLLERLCSSVKSSEHLGRDQLTVILVMIGSKSILWTPLSLKGK